MPDKEKILVIDDEQYARELIQTFLHSEGYQVASEITGELALDRIKEEKFDCLLVDLKLPGMNGIDVLREVKKINEDICVIIITGYATIESAIIAMKEGASDYICKPFLDLRQILIGIERALQSRSLILTNRNLVEDLKITNNKLQNTIGELGKSYEQLKKVYIGSYASLAATIDARDKYTSGHSEKVAEYALLLGRSLKLSNGELEDLEHACRFHDIGKIAVPDSILLKQGELTEEEWIIMKRHPVQGANILEPLKFIMNDIIDIVKYHHERYNGLGYPEGLKEEAIPFAARIVSIADAFEAMIAGRHYQRKIEKVEAIERLRAGAGTQFDPQLVEEFISVVGD